MRKLALTLIPLFLLVACSDHPTALNQAAPAPTFTFSNGPAEPGHSYIVRGEYGDFAWFLVDPNTELAALVTGDDLDCLEFAGATLVPTQTILNRADAGLQLYGEGGWLNAAIVAPPYECDDVLATGLVHNNWHDNDVFAWLYDHNRANAFGGTISGRVGAYNVSYSFHVVWGGVGNPDFHGAFVEKISVK